MLDVMVFLSKTLMWLSPRLVGNRRAYVAVYSIASVGQIVSTTLLTDEEQVSHSEHENLKI